MKEAGLDYFANRAGANLHVGIVTEFIMNSTLSGRMKKHYCVMECDEAASVRIFADTLPKVITVTNLFADQVDRFGDVKGTASYIKKAISQVPEAALVLNGDCPVSASLAYGMPNRTILFGFEETAVPGDEIPEKTDIPSCMNCGEAQYEYSYIVFDHLGGFKCPKCGVQRKKADIGVLDLVIFQICQFMVVSGKKGLGMNLLLDMLNHCPGNAHAVKGAGAAANLV